MERAKIPDTLQASQERAGRLGSTPAARTVAARFLMAFAAGVCVAFLSLPLLALLLHVPLDTLFTYLQDPLVTSALQLSAVSSLCTLALILLFGSPLAYHLARSCFRGQRLL